MHPGLEQLLKANCSVRREEAYDVDLRLVSYDYSQHVSSFVRSTSVDTTFGQDVTLLLFNPYHIISAVTALQDAIQLEVACSFL